MNTWAFRIIASLVLIGVLVGAALLIGGNDQPTSRPASTVVAPEPKSVPDHAANQFKNLKIP